jgi:hypothetical protein
MEAGITEDTACIHCGAALQTIKHLLCQCTASPILNIREQYGNSFCGLNLSLLPNHIIHGVPAAVTAGADTTYWGQSFQDIGGTALSQNARKLVGLDSMGYSSFGLEIDSLIAFSTNNGHAAALESDIDRFANARQILAHLNPPINTTPDVIEDFSTPVQIGEAPDNTNVHSDGSVQNPSLVHLQLATGGVWWRDRTTTHPLSDLETNYTNVQSYSYTFRDKINRHSVGLALALAHSSINTSSTRAELLAGIGALLAKVPTHLAADNLCFINGANVIIRAVNRNISLGENILSTPDFAYRFRKHWALIPDGDLWRLFYVLTKARTPHSLRVTKVKGHATQEHLDSGSISTNDREDNFAADDIAGRYWTDTNPSLSKWVNFMALRHRNYSNFMGIWTRYAAHILAYDSEVRQKSLST